MSACPQCGTVAKPNDKFCNICGTPLARQNPPAGAAAPPAFATPAQPAPPPGGFAPPPAGNYGAPAPPVVRCQMGHEIVPGASYCAQGHPIALDQMQFSSDPYGAPGAGYPAPPPAPAAFGGPSPAGYGPPPGYPPPAQGGGYAPPPAPGYPPQPPAYPPPGGGGFGAPPAPPAYGAQPAVPYTPPPPYAAPPAPVYLSDASREAVPAQVLRGFLVAYGSNPAGDHWALTAGRHVVGRAGSGEGLDIPLQDPTISSRHAALLVDGPSASVMVEDTGSTNGTFVNDEHIGFNGRRELRDGDRLRFGGFTTVVKVIGRV